LRVVGLACRCQRFRADQDDHLQGLFIVSRMVPDVLVQVYSGDDWAGVARTVATEPATDLGRARTWPSLRSAPDESLSRLAGWGLHLRQQATRRRRALARDLARLQDRAPEGWPLLPSRTTTHVAASYRAAGTGTKCAPAPTWPEGPKEGSRRPRATVPWWPARHGRTPRRSAISAAVTRCSRMYGGQPRPGAERALEYVLSGAAAGSS